jgi:hypothetical protein
MAVDRVDRHTGSGSYIQGQLVIMRMKRRNTIMGVCCTWGMLYLVRAVVGVCCTRCQLMTMTWRDREGDLTLCSAMIVELWTRTREIGDEDENNVITTRYETSGVRLA